LIENLMAASDDDTIKGNVAQTHPAAAHAATTALCMSNNDVLMHAKRKVMLNGGTARTAQATRRRKQACGPIFNRQIHQGDAAGDTYSTSWPDPAALRRQPSRKHAPPISQGAGSDTLYGDSATTCWNGGTGSDKL
jgi:hypothetical protein